MIFYKRTINGKKNEPEAEKDYLRLFDKGEYNAAVIAAFRFLEITLSRKYELCKDLSDGIPKFVKHE